VPAVETAASIIGPDAGAQEDRLIEKPKATTEDHWHHREILRRHFENRVFGGPGYRLCRGGNPWFGFVRRDGDWSDFFFSGTFKGRCFRW